VHSYPWPLSLSFAPQVALANAKNNVWYQTRAAVDPRTVTVEEAGRWELAVQATGPEHSTVVWGSWGHWVRH
jgi:hypothetical protein